MADDETVALEDEDPLAHVGEDSEAPQDIGDPPAPGDEEPPTDDPGDEEEPPTEPRTRGGFRVAKSLLLLRADIDARWPERDRRTDGFIGDAAHCPPGKPSKSDHCPNAANVVRAFDIDVDGIRADWLAEFLRTLGAKGDGRLANGGYVIFNRRIASSTHGWRWREYTGSDPHTSHIHLSITQDASGYDAGGGWGVRAAKIPPGPVGQHSHSASDLPKHPLGARVLKVTTPFTRGTDVAFVQRFVGADDDGAYGDKTKGRVERFQRIVSIQPTGVVGPETWKAMRVK